MKIYWKNLIWNYTGRYWYLFKFYKNGFHKSKWRGFYYPQKKFWNSKQKAELYRKFDEALKKIDFNLN